MAVKEVICPNCWHEQIIGIEDDTILCEACGDIWYIEESVGEE